jgi:uncharacterized protein YecE (DUF72 family)
VGHIYVGTSAFSEPGWRGGFYPPGLPAERMLAYYAQRLDAVEVNSTLYRMPTPAVLAGWAAQVPDGFRFALKAPRRVGLQPGSALRRLLQVLPALGDRLGPTLFQVPHLHPADPAALAALLRALPRGLRAAFDLRHPSWRADPAVDDLLARAGAARAGVDDLPPLPGSDFVYVRIRESGLPPAAWAARLRGHAAGGRDVYAFVKHQREVDSPGRALAIAQEVARAPAHR